jgi:hypothetical protein
VQFDTRQDLSLKMQYRQGLLALSRVDKATAHIKYRLHLSDGFGGVANLIVITTEALWALKDKENQAT